MRRLRERVACLRQGLGYSLYAWLSAALLLVVLLGFSRTYYGRILAGTDGPPIQPSELPFHLHAHGIVLTAWFLLAVVQPTLIATRRNHIHRLLGWIGVGLAIAVVVLTTLVLFRAVPQPATGIPADALPFVVVGDFMLLITFSMFVIAALVFRRDRETHMRLMLLASTAIFIPAVARLPGAAAFGPAIPLAARVAVPLALIVHDCLRLGRVHRATIAGTVVLVIGFLAGGVVGGSPVGRAILERLV